MGSVWEVEQVSTGRPIALKLPHLRALIEPEDARRFNEEAAITARLEHPNIVRVVDWSPDGPWIAYELLPGPTLQSWLDARKPTFAELIDVARQIALALDCAHLAGVVHRDVKPENVIRAADGVWKVTDFGVARWDANPVKTRTGIVLGTPPYIAPEIVAGERAGPSSDLYALGILLYRVLTGRIPHDTNDALQLLMARMATPATPVLEVTADVPPGLALVVDRLLAMKPADRPASAAALIVELDGALARRSMTSRRLSRAPSTGRIPRLGATSATAIATVAPPAVSRARLAIGIFATGLAATCFIYLRSVNHQNVEPPARFASIYTPASIYAPAASAPPAAPALTPVDRIAALIGAAPVPLTRWAVDWDAPRVRVPLVVPYTAATPSLALEPGVRVKSLDGAALPDASAGKLPPLAPGLHWLELDAKVDAPLGFLGGVAADAPDWGPRPPDPSEAATYYALLETAHNKELWDASEAHLPGDPGPRGGVRQIANLVLNLRRCAEVPKFLDALDSAMPDVRLIWAMDAIEIRARIPQLLDDLALPLAAARPRWDAWHLLGWILANTDQRPQARRALLRALRTSPDNPWTWLELARLEEREERAQAIRHERSAELAALDRKRMTARRALELLAGLPGHYRVDAQQMIEAASHARRPVR